MLGAVTVSYTHLDVYKRQALVTRLAHGVKHGLDWQTAREPLASLFYNCKHHIAKQQHAVERTSELFAKSLGYSLSLIHI